MDSYGKGLPLCQFKSLCLFLTLSQELAVSENCDYMIRVSIEKVKPDQIQALREWMGDLMLRVSEVKETFAQEGVSHEQAHLVETSDGHLLIYVMESDDHEKARKAFKESTLPLDIEHRKIMNMVLEGKFPSELLYECKASQDSR